MNKLLRNSHIFFLIFTIFFIPFFMRAEAFSLNLDPLVQFFNASNSIIEKVTDIAYKFIQQKEKYTFDDSVAPITIEMSSLPNLRKTEIGLNFLSLGQVVPSAPGLVVKSNSAGGEAGKTFTDSQILNYTNSEREKLSLQPLVANKALDVIANLRADDLFTNQYFDHNSPDGKSATDLARIVGYNYNLIGENLALGNFTEDQEIVSAWMNSPGHKANILNEKYGELGVAVKEGVYDGAKTIIAVQIFAEPQASCTKPNPASKIVIDNLTNSIKQMQVEAQAMLKNINDIKITTAEDQANYRQKIQEYNSFAQKINTAVQATKGMIDQYNIEVNKYNTCIAS